MYFTLSYEMYLYIQILSAKKALHTLFIINPISELAEVYLFGQNF